MVKVKGEQLARGKKSPLSPPRIANPPKIKSVDRSRKAHLVDWEEVTYQVRETSLPFNAIARQHGVSEATLSQWIKRNGVKRDLRGRVRAQTDDELDKIVRHEEIEKERDPLKKRTDSDRIAALARVRATVILSHRRDIKAQRRLLSRLTRELEAESTFLPELRELVVKMTKGRKINEKDGIMLIKVVDRMAQLANRTDILKKLTDCLKTLLTLEREAFDLNEPQEKPKDSEDSVEHSLKGIYQAISGRSRGLPSVALPSGPVETEGES